MAGILAYEAELGAGRKWLQGVDWEVWAPCLGATLVGLDLVSAVLPEQHLLDHSCGVENLGVEG